MEIAIFGAGHVGLAQGITLVQQGHRVSIFDSDRERIHRLCAGEYSGLSLSLAGALHSCLTGRSGALRLTSDTAEIREQAKVVLIAVGTPSGIDGAADVSAVYQVVCLIAERLPPDVAVVIRSTVPVGTNRSVEKMLCEAFVARGFEFTGVVISNPEFLRLGHEIEDCRAPSRIVFGTRSPLGRAVILSLYHEQLRSKVPLIEISPESAELGKYAANAMLATRVSFMNEMARLARSLEADIEGVRQVVGSDPRIGWDFLESGIGFGGPCLPKDLRALITQGEQAGVDMTLVNAVREVNGTQVDHIVKQITMRWPSNTRLVVSGLGFKPGTDNATESQAVEIVRKLAAEGYQIRLSDESSSTGLRWGSFWIAEDSIFLGSEPRW